MYDDLLDQDNATPDSTLVELPSIARAATLWMLVMLAFFYAPFSWDILRGPVSGAVTISIYGVLILMGLLFSVGLTYRAILQGNGWLWTYAALHIGAWVWGLAFFVLEGTFVHMVGIALGGSLLMILAEFHRQYTPKPWFWKGLLWVTSIHVLENGVSAVLVGYEVWQVQLAQTTSLLLYLGIGGYTLYQVAQYWKTEQVLRLLAVGSLLLAWVSAGMWHAVFHYRLEGNVDPITLEVIHHWTYPLIGRLPLACWLWYLVGVAAALGARNLRMEPFDYPE